MSDLAKFDDDGNLVIRLHDMIQELPTDQRGELAKSVAFDSTLMEAAVGSLVDGMAFDDCWWIGGDFVEKLREKVVPLLPKVTQELVLDLIRSRDQAKEHAKRWESWAWKLYHFRRAGDQDPWSSGDYEYIHRGGREAMAEMQKLLGEEEATNG